MALITTRTEELMRKCEATRRCKHNTDTILKVLPRSSGVPDYSSGMLKLGIAMHHLEEGLPNQQRERVLAAMEAMREGHLELEQFLAAAGYYKREVV